jgi:hypothetical protein
MGREMYVLHDNGRKLFDSATECTPMQRFVYILAKDYHEDDPNEGHSDPHGLEKAKQFSEARRY